MIRRASAGWDANADDRELVEAHGGDFWDGKRLGEEAPVRSALPYTCDETDVLRVEREVDDDFAVVSKGDPDSGLYASITYVPAPSTSDWRLTILCSSPGSRLPGMVAVSPLFIIQIR
jgi:hypothetical protein